MPSLGGQGNDALDGGAGIDTAVFSGTRANFTMAVTGSGYLLTDTTGRDGADSLVSIERLQFSDVKLALDVFDNAEKVVKILGVTFGPSSVTNKQYVGIGLGYLDGGMSYADLTAFAMQAAGVTSNAAAVSLLWTNIFGSAPTAAQAAPYVALLDNGSFTFGTLGVFAADQGLNKSNINLVGLQQTGIEFI